ncbi:CGNR zinc finger domain-containing protein [Actinacidiphila rubida]|uniref:CGNR zinc finger domain-containing protein n=1 Tax=Actinacidiphila rubida TaxID=310780 RepID=A0A1H8HU20_9ACTN|nr:CGNR zinc finger domain-containing protein [Actinacidiphila rubida]SEN59485.1 CGNR zinc finger domain-containing protein [Actinacidiphila rubida]
MGELRFDCGRLCLNLVATRAGRPPAERLGGRAGLREWLAGAALVPRGEPLDVGDGWPAAFTTLRATLERLLTAQLRGEPPAAADVDALNAAARGTPVAPTAVRQDDGTLARVLATPPTCDALLATVARDAVDLFTDPIDRARLRACEGEDCTVVYLDTSRGRRRRWCSSEVCGNRERVARHRRRAAPPAVQG